MFENGRRVINFCVDQTEYDYIKALSKREGESVAVLIRRMFREQQEKEKKTSRELVGVR